MHRYEYKVVPAPVKGRKAKGVRTPEGRFALSVEDVLNQMAADGWEYLRAELLPSEERQGLTGSATNWRNVLVFRRATDAAVAAAPDAQAGAQAGFPPLAAPASVAAANTVVAPPLGPAAAAGGKAPPVVASRVATGETATADDIAEEEPEADRPDEDKAEEAEARDGDETLSGIERVMRLRGRRGGKASDD